MTFVASLDVTAARRGWMALPEEARRWCAEVCGAMPFGVEGEEGGEGERRRRQSQVGEACSTRGMVEECWGEEESSAGAQLWLCGVRVRV